jgi:hypothetical protein
MKKQIYNENQLPVDDFKDIGLYKDGQIQLQPDDVKALLEGRRTDMTVLRDLKMDGFEIAELKAKLSLYSQRNGDVRLFVHPKYTKAVAPMELNDEEVEELIDGEVANIEKEIGPRGASKKVLFEFDEETNEFIMTEEGRIIAPDQVNGEALSLDQKERYRSGKEIQLSDGTRFQFTGKEQQGVRSNKLALVASIMVDGGFSFALYHGLKAMFGEKHDQKSKEYSKGYDQAVKDLKQKKETGPELNLKQESRGYNRSTSR